METLLDLSTLSIEEVTGRIKTVDDREEAPPTNPVSVDGKLLFSEEQWLACQKKKQVGPSLSKDHRRQPRKKSTGGGGSGAKGGGDGDGECGVTRDDTCLNCGHRG
jgi:hypothetical protein